MEGLLITRTMLLIAIRQQKWMEAGSMASELVESSVGDLMETVNEASKNAAKEDGVAQTLLSLWAELEWLAINEG